MLRLGLGILRMSGKSLLLLLGCVVPVESCLLDVTDCESRKIQELHVNDI